MFILRHPGQALLDECELDESFLGDRQRLYQHADLAQLRWNHVHVPLVIDDEFGHEAVRAIDSTLGEIAGVAEVLAAGTAGDTTLVRAGTAHHGDHQVSLLDAGDERARFHNLTQRFVSDDQVVLTRRSDTVVEAADFAVSAADPYVQHAQPG